MTSQNPIDIYQLLTGVKLDDATVEQLDSAAGRTYVDKASREFWTGILTVSHTMKAARTYAHGLPIPELGEMKTVAVADAASGSIQPSGTEVWLVQNIDTDNCVAFLTDGSGMMALTLGGDNATVTGPLYLTNKLYIGFSNASGSAQTPGIAFQKVSL